MTPLPVSCHADDGQVRLPQSAVEGRFSSSTAGDDRLRIHLDLDRSVQIRTALNKAAQRRL
jgi:hypothetical protein